MKYIHVYALLMFVFCTYCGQNQTSVPQDNIKSEIKDIGPNIKARNIRKDSNSTILIASSGGVFRFDPSADRRSDALRA